MLENSLYSDLLFFHQNEDKFQDCLSTGYANSIAMTTVKKGFKKRVIVVLLKLLKTLNPPSMEISLLKSDV